MARDGNGTYSLPEAAFVYDTVIDETAVNSDFSDIAAALTASLAKDGQTVPTANLPMGTYRHTGVGNASARDQYAAMGQVQDGEGIWCGTAGGTANALTLTPSPAITAYAAGQKFEFKAGAAPNTTAVTFAVSGLSAIAGQVNGAACVGGEILANQWYRVTLTDASTAQIERIGAAAAGTVTSITAGTGMTGGTITTSGTLAVDVGTTANKIVQLDGTAKLPAVDGSQLTNLPGGGGWVLLTTSPFSGASAVNFTSQIDGTYDAYVIEFSDVTFSQDIRPAIRVSTDGGSSFLSTTIYEQGVYGYTSLGVAFNYDGTGATQIYPVSSSNVVSSAAAASLNGFVYLFKPSSSSHWKTIRGAFTFSKATGSFEVVDSTFCGVAKTTTAVNAISFYPLAGTTSGTARLFGIQNS